MDLIQRIREKALLRGKFLTRAGKEVDYYFDLRRLYGDPEFVNEVVDRLWEYMNCDANCVVGYGFGGMPLATVISSRHGLRLTNIRGNEKEYGTRNKLEGHQLNSGDRLVVPDDVFTSGSSLRKATEIILPTGAEIIKYGVIVNREEGDPTSLQFPLDYLFTTSQILEG